MAALAVQVEDGLGTLRLGRAHGNAINQEMVDALIEACRQLERDASVRGILLASSGKLFSPGLDLQELVDYDRPAMERFLTRFNAAILMLYTLSKPVVAALHGHAIAGGCVLGLTADWRVLADGAMVGLNEVRVGVPLPFGVASILRESIGRNHLEEVALLGRNYEGAEAVGTGLVDETHAPEGFEEHCTARLREFAEKDPVALSITKRYLRSATVERIRANDPQLTGEFLDSWFTPATRDRIERVVAGLRK